MSLSVTKKRRLAALAAACLASVALPAAPALAQKVKNKTPAAEASAPSVDVVVTIPSVDTVQSNMDAATITDILSGNLTENAEALAALDAESISIPEIIIAITAKTDDGPEVGTMTLTNLVLEDVTDGVAASMRLEGSSFVSPEGDAAMGASEASAVNIAAILGIYGLVSADPTSEMETLYADFTMEGGSFTSEEIACSIGAISVGEVRGRPFESSFTEIMTLAQTLEDSSDDDITPELLGKIVHMYADVLTAFESSPATFDGIDCAGTDNDGRDIAFALGNVTMGGMSPGIYPQISVDDITIAAEEGTMSLANFTFKQFDLSSVIATLQRAPERVDESWLEANARGLVPSFEGVSLSGFAMDIADPDKNDERIVANVDAFDLSLKDYLNGIPSALDTWAKGIKIALPLDTNDEQVQQLIDLGITNIDAGFRFAAAWNEETSNIDITEISVSGVDLATVALKGTIANATEALFSLDESEALMAGMELAVSALSVDVLDAGLSDIVLAVAGAEQDMDPAAMRPIFAGLAEGTVVGMMAGVADAAKLGSALGQFVSGKAKSLNISIEAKEAPGLTMIDFMMAEDDPATLLQKVNIDASAK
ncbi:MAG: hypothetical protein IR164_14795 [Devosia sp.]|jgi:hypothetical protein|uniref:hypothetical protein n=1 Tax=unclassified Devosia TaxID=196773 RepID=UPI0019F9373B|nr:MULTISPECIES: hypothetical protein [unclassified Devosia]MBF0680196.1 hypothetical protein [Devosia sp.]WEJ34932.1 hypothetical protein NYQ88_09095 [Devosia sp. SD17-2]